MKHSYVLIAEIRTDLGIEQAMIPVDHACYDAWQQGRSDDLYHYLPADCQAVQDVITTRQLIDVIDNALKREAQA